MKKSIIIIIAALGIGVDLNAQTRDSVQTHILEEVIINVERKSLDRSSETASKLRLKNIENPQVVNSVNQLVIQQQGISNFPDALRNIAGITRSWASVSPFYTSRGFMVRNYIRNGMVSYAASDMDLVNIEQIDMVKGPVGTLFGSSAVSFGGMINRVTKQPLKDKKISAGYQFGSYDLSRFITDINLPLNEEQTALFRINASHTYNGSFSDAGYLKSTFIAPSILYKVNDRLILSLDAEIYGREGTSEPQFSPVGPKQKSSSGTWAATPEQLNINYKKSFSNNSITLKDPARNFYGKVEYKISDKWRMQTNIMNGNTSNTGNYLTFGIKAGDSILQRRVSHYPTSKITTIQIQQNFMGDFKVGPVRNRFVAGLDYYRISNNSESNALNGRGGRPVYDELTISGINHNYNDINPDLISDKLSGYLSIATKSVQNTVGIYVSDVINPTEHLSVMLSARFDRFLNDGSTNLVTGTTSGNYNQNSFSPKLGVVYEFIENQFAVFANYNNGFQNTAPVTQPDGSVSAFKPQYANQTEFGVKTDLLKNKLTATLSYYDIRVRNVLRSAVVDPTFTVQEGNQFSKGVELDLISSPVDGLFLKAGYAYNNSRLTNAEAAVNGLRPVSSGPEHTVNWYASYTFEQAVLKGLGIGLGGNFSGKNYLINNTANGQFYTNEYTLFNANIFYDQPRYRFSINAENLGNKRYYYGGLGNFTPGMLQRVSASIHIRV
ncbi:TonB-dependent siderophore receptor [Flavobacterium aquidurense]|uniref:TonB-dependent siderophore receptor n=1 Tax=Flavobacterium aquidurense TaxID=362413 RepID=UPI0037575DF1